MTNHSKFSSSLRRHFNLIRLLCNGSIPLSAAAQILSKASPDVILACTEICLNLPTKIKRLSVVKVRIIRDITAAKTAKKRRNLLLGSWRWLRILFNEILKDEEGGSTEDKQPQTGTTNDK